MNRLVDKIPLLCLCIIILTQWDTALMPVVALTLFTALSALCQSFPNSKLSLITLLTAIVLCYFSPTFSCMLPLLCYDLLHEKKHIMILSVLPPLLMYSEEFQVIQLCLIVFGIMISIYLCMNTTKIIKLESDLIQIRDTSEEVNLLLQDKNKRLCENQDYEISLATMKERNRIAREIHDNVGHLLTRSILQVGALQILNKDEDQKENLENLKATLSGAMTTIRNSVHDLHDDSIDLKLLIKDAIKPLQDKYHVSSDLDFSDKIPQNVKLCLLGIVKECVSNVIKHSNANKVDLVIREHPAFYQLLFLDNGKEKTTVSDSGIGLSNMQERAASVGGIISFTPSDSGFKVFLSIPKE